VYDALAHFNMGPSIGFGHTKSINLFCPCTCPHLFHFNFPCRKGSNVIHRCSDKIALLIPSFKTRNLRALYKGNQEARTLIHTRCAPREQKVFNLTFNEGEKEECEERSVWLMTAYVKPTFCSKFDEVSKMYNLFHRCLQRTLWRP